MLKEKTVQIRITAKARQGLRIMAAKRDMTITAIVEEFINSQEARKDAGRKSYPQRQL